MSGAGRSGTEVKVSPAADSELLRLSQRDSCDDLAANRADMEQQQQKCGERNEPRSKRAEAKAAGVDMRSSGKVGSGARGAMTPQRVFVTRPRSSTQFRATVVADWCALGPTERVGGTRVGPLPHKVKPRLKSETHQSSYWSRRFAQQGRRSVFRTDPP